MPQKPSFPPPPAARSQAPLAPHVALALGAVQAKPSPDSRAARVPAPHVQAALGRTLQRKPEPSPPAAARLLAPHVQRAVVQPKSAAPGPSARLAPRPGGVLQPSSEKSFENLKNYSSVLDSYDEADVRELLDQGYEVRGHHSGTPGDRMNSATTGDISDLTEALRKKKEKEKAAKKKPVIRQQVKKSLDEKAKAMAEQLFKAEGVEVGLGSFTEYLERRSIPEDQWDDLIDFFMSLKPD